MATSHLYSYDQGTNGKGHLTQVTDGSGSTQWSYDAHGRVTSKQQTVVALTRSIGYGYNSVGQLTQVTTPSGQTVVYGYTHNRITSITVDGVTLLNQVSYSPFGPTTGWHWGNGTLTSRGYDTDGYLTTNNSAGSARYTFNADGSIQSVTDDNPPLYLSGAGTTTDSINASSNQLNSSSGALTRSYNYDAAGNITSDGIRSFTFNNAGRMSSASNAGLTTNYLYNALGERIKKSNAANTTVFIYDEAGHLAGEYDQAGTLIQEIVWLDDIPVATIRTDQGGTGAGVFYIHTDHLNVPTKVTRPSDNAVIWRWDHDPYGNGTPNQDPDGNGLQLTMNLRFPGQYFDQETGLLHNGYRDYDPASGRYMESDPIGLFGGINTYAYVGGNPIFHTDALGLMCTAGLGCYTTPAERQAAVSGNYAGYYQLACAGGDDYACFAEHVAANDNFWGHRATNRLKDALRKKAEASQQCLNEDKILDQIRTDLAYDYASYLPDSPDKARWPNAQDIAQFHRNEFEQFGLPADTFGGTPFGQNGPLFLPNVWCPNCQP